VAKTPALIKPAPRKHQQVVQSLRELVTTMSPGERLPSVADLERQFEVSSSPIKAALGMLRSEGLVVSRPRSGIYVAQPGLPAAATSAPNGRRPHTGIGTLAVLAPSHVPFFRHCVDELTRQAERRDLKLVCHYYSDREMALADALALEALRPVGYLLFYYVLAPLAAALRERGHRAVVVGVPPAEALPGVPCVFGDHEHGAHLAARRLLLLGHRRVAYGPGFPGADPREHRRWRGCERALREAGLDPTVIGPQLLRAWREDPGAARGYFADPGAPTALMAWTDAVAVELLHLLPRAGLRVPEDVSVVGYDNLPFGAHSRPPLDTIDGHVEVQVRHALDLLASPMGPGTMPTAVVTPTLVCRESCARPRD
jgi:DNA-binding LacI/PurR family transcriptional regulator